MNTLYYSTHICTRKIKQYFIIHTTRPWRNHFWFSLWRNCRWCAACCHKCSCVHRGCRFLFWNRFLVTAISI